MDSMSRRGGEQQGKQVKGLNLHLMARPAALPAGATRMRLVDRWQWAQAALLWHVRVVPDQSLPQGSTCPFIIVSGP